MNEKYTPKRNSKARGFTVMELIITIALIAILALISIPSFQRISTNGNLKTAARDLIADFNALRERAMADNTQCIRPATGECYDLTFNVGNNTYTVDPPSGLPNGGKSPASIAQDIHLTAGTSLTFLTRGTLSQPGNVVLINSRGSTALKRRISNRQYDAKEGQGYEYFHQGKSLGRNGSFGRSFIANQEITRIF